MAIQALNRGQLLKFRYEWSKSRRRVTGGSGYTSPDEVPGRPAAGPNGPGRRSRPAVGEPRSSPRRPPIATAAQPNSRPLLPDKYAAGPGGNSVKNARRPVIAVDKNILIRSLANLSLVVDWVKYGDAKNAALPGIRFSLARWPRESLAGCRREANRACLGVQAYTGYSNILKLSRELNVIRQETGLFAIAAAMSGFVR